MAVTAAQRGAECDAPHGAIPDRETARVPAREAHAVLFGRLHHAVRLGQIDCHRLLDEDFVWDEYTIPLINVIAEIAAEIIARDAARDEAPQTNANAPK
jgi:hypothetical protein